MTRKSILIYAPVAILAAYGCGGLRDRVDEQQDRAEERREERTVAEDLRGTWLSGCLPSAARAGQFTRETIRIEEGGGDDFERRLEAFTDANCTKRWSTRTLRGDYHLADTLQEGANDIRFSVEEAVLKPESPEGAAALNQSRYCGRADWQANVEQGIMGDACPEAGLTQDLEIIDIFDIRQGSLLLGQPSFLLTGPAASARPASLDLARPYTRQDNQGPAGGGGGETGGGRVED